MKATSLSQSEDGRLYYRGQLFSGLAYDVNDQAIVQGIEVIEQGKRSEPSDDWLDLEKGERVDGGHLEIMEDYGPWCWQGRPFSGLAYFFEPSGACVIEEAYDEGEPTELAKRAWYSSGAPKQVVQGQEGSVWFENGSLQAKGEGNNVFLNFGLRNDGRLSVLVLRDPHLFELSTAQQLPFSDKVSLIGSAIDRDLLVSLRDHTELSSVRHLRIIETGLGPEGIDVLVSLSRLTTLWLQRNSRLHQTHVEQIRARRPSCTINYESDEDSF